MNTILSDNSLLKKPSAFIPLLMPLIALTIVLVHFEFVGIVHERDEGTLAHIFQLLIIVQIPFVIIFLFSWVNKKPKQTLLILAIQVITGMVAIGVVYFLT